MRATIFDHRKRWSEEDYLALGVTEERVELFDGSLHVSPAPTPQHQRITRQLLFALDAGCAARGYEALPTINVRLRPGRITIPDLAVTTKINMHQPVVDAVHTRLVCEIVSPGNAATDRVRKMRYYAAAGIEWYLLVEQQTGSLRLYRLDGGHYVERAGAGPGEKLVMTEPIDAVLEPEALAPHD